MSPMRFFTVVPLHSAYMLWALAIVAGSGTVTLLVDATKGVNAIAPLLLVQMFAASTGFSVAAQRGHLDLLFTSGPRRIRIVLTHLALSILPGLAVWWLLGLVEAIVGGTWGTRAFASGTVVAVVFVSCVSWALTVRVPPLSGGIAWVLIMVLWLVGWPDGMGVVAAVVDGSAGFIAHAAAVVLCPFLLLGRQLSANDGVVAIPALVLMLTLVGVAVRWLVRTSVPLEAAQ